MTAERREIVISDGHRIVYDVSGSGPPVVVIPGITTDRALWHRAGYVNELRTDYKVVAVDPLGHGDSDRPHGPVFYGGNRLVEHLMAVLDAEGLERCAVWGYSRGGLIGALAAWADPARVSLLVLGGTPLHFLDSPLPLPVDEAAADALAGGEWGPWWEQSPPLPEGVRSAVEAANDPRAISAALRGMDPIELRPLQPSTVAYLGSDEDFGSEALEAASSIGVPTALLPTGGHAETFMASDEVISFVRPFLAANAG